MTTAALPASIANLVKPTIYLSCAETAKLLRKALKEAFPEIKFSVRSSTYSGGASIDVAWTSGPTDEQVKAVTDAFIGADFDGMTDSMNYHTHAIDGQVTRYGADFIFTRRDFPKEKADALAAVFASTDRANWLAIAGNLDMGQLMLRCLSHHFDAREIAYAILKAMPALQFEGRRSATAERVNALD